MLPPSAAVQAVWRALYGPLAESVKQQAIAVYSSIFGKVSCKPKVPSPLEVSALVLCETLLSCFGQGGAVD